MRGQKRPSLEDPRGRKEAGGSEERDKAWQSGKGRHTYVAWRSAHFTPQKEKEDEISIEYSSRNKAREAKR
jgi:hypothetical protein